MDDLEKPEFRLPSCLGGLRRRGGSQKEPHPSASDREHVKVTNRLETLRLACTAISATLDPQAVLAGIARVMIGTGMRSRWCCLTC